MCLSKVEDRISDVGTVYNTVRNKLYYAKSTFLSARDIIVDTRPGAEP